MRSTSGRERLRLPLGDARGRLVEAQHPRPRAPIRQASSTMRRVPVDSSSMKWSGVAAEPEERDQLVGLRPLATLGRRERRQRRARSASDAPRRAPRARPAPSRARSGRGTGRPPGTCGRGRARPRRRRRQPRRRRRPASRSRPSTARTRRPRSSASTCPAPFVPMRPTTSPCADVEVDVVDGDASAEAHADARRRASAGTSAGSCTRLAASSTTRAGIGAPAVFVTSAGRQALGEHRTDEVAEVSNDLHEPAREVEDQDQQAGAAREQARRLACRRRTRAARSPTARRARAPLIDDSPPITAIATTRSDSSGGNALGAELHLHARRAARRPARRARPRRRTRSSFVRVGEIVNAAAPRSLSRTARSERPTPLRRMRPSTTAATTSAPRHDVVVGALVAQPVRPVDADDRLRAEQERPLEQPRLRHHRERERRHREEQTPYPQRRRADDHRDHGRDDHGEDDRQLERQGRELEARTERRQRHPVHERPREDRAKPTNANWPSDSCPAQPVRSVRESATTV